MRITTLVLATVLVAMMMVIVNAGRHNSIDYTKVLKNYVSQPESVYSYSLLGTVPTPVATVYVLNVTTLSYLTPGEVGVRSTWFNYVTVAVPVTLDRTKTQATVYFTSGSNTQGPPAPDAVITPFAYVTKSVGITVYDVPNQPITFTSDPTHASRSEDGIIAFGWKRFINDSSQVDYVTQMQMVKTSKLSLDAVVDFVKKTINYSIVDFNVIGASKRGWSSILLAGVDNRVQSLIPAVIPVWQTKKVFERTYNNICYWPPAMADYIAAGVTNDIFTQGFEKLTKIVDPVNYPRLATIPKYQILSMGDEFFSPDLNDLSYSSIEGEKYVRYIPNTGHSLSGSDVFQVVLTYQAARLTGVELPKYDFSHKFTEEGIIVKVKVKNNKTPTKVVLWTANNPNGREFRTYIIGTNVWNSTLLQEIKPNEWQVLVRNPPAGYTALTVELVWDNFVGAQVPGVAMAPLKFTTNGYVVPNTIPCQLTPPSTNPRKVRK